MPISLGEIAQTVGGVLVGSPEKLISAVALIDDATAEQITFTDDRQTLLALDRPGVFAAGAVIVPSDYDGSRYDVIKVDHPQLACARVIALLHPPVRPVSGVSPRAEISDTAVLGGDIHIGPFVSIGRRSIIGDRVSIQAGACLGDDVVIGDDSTIGCRAIVMSGTRIGCRVVIHPGAILGGDGFGYVEEDDASLRRIPHVGRVVIEDDVEIGAGATVERANLGQTLVKQGAKIGSLVHVGHNVTIGRNTRIVAQAGIGGNTVIGDQVMIGGQAGIEQNLVIGDHAVIGPQAGIISDVPAGDQVYGTPGMPRRAWLRSGLLIPRLLRMQRELDRLGPRRPESRRRGDNRSED